MNDVIYVMPNLKLKKKKEAGKLSNISYEDICYEDE